MNPKGGGIWTKSSKRIKFIGKNARLRVFKQLFKWGFGVFKIMCLVCVGVSGYVLE